MSQNRNCRMMSLLLGILLFSTIISNCNVEASRYRKVKTEDADMRALRQLVRELQWNNHKRLFFQARAEEEGDCTADILVGYQWDGEEAVNKPGIDTVQRCMDTCDMHSKCVGWSYKPASQMCWGFSSITGVIKVADVKSGSCIGRSIKTQCTDKQSGQYSGQQEQELAGIATVEDCMSKCDQLNVCYGWLYSSDEKKCYLYSVVGKLQTDTYFMTGSCIAPQKRVRFPEPLKMFRKDTLERHNEKRTAHCETNLTLNANLNKISQDLADKLAAADITPPVYEATGMQTVYFNKGDDDLLGSRIVDCFYDEQKYYDWKTPDFTKTSHFPKVIWKSSKMLGVGRAFTSDKGTMFVVTSYDSTDDIATSFKDNVQPKCA